MNSLLFRSITIALILAVQSFCATVTEAYSLFLQGAFKESLAAYKEIYKESGSSDAFYGMINSLTYLERYEEALFLCRTGSDPVLSAKEIWILGIQNKKKNAEKSVKKHQKSFNKDEMATIYQSGGFGFSKAGKYREAVKWFDSSLKMKEDKLTREALLYNRDAAKNRVIWSGTLLTGIISYSDNAINENGSSYTYDKGSFTDIGSRWDIKKKHTFEIIWSRFDASFKNSMTYTDYYYGINYDSTLYHSLDSDARWPWNGSYSLYDSLDSWLNSDAEHNRYVKTPLDSIRDSITGAKYHKDTAYSLYEEYYLGSENEGDFDSVVTVKSESVNRPSAVYQNNLYLAYTNWYVRDRKLNLGFAVNLLQSNMQNMNNGITLYGFHDHIIRKVTLSGNWYTTHTEEISVLQASPTFSTHFGKFTLDLTPTYLFKSKAPEELQIPGVQLSLESQLKYTNDLISLDGKFSFGKRTFLSESKGKHLINVILQHQYSGSLLFSLTPGKKYVTFFSMMRFEKYKQMNRLIALGGLTVSI